MQYFIHLLCSAAKETKKSQKTTTKKPAAASAAAKKPKAQKESFQSVFHFTGFTRFCQQKMQSKRDKITGHFPVSALLLVSFLEGQHSPVLAPRQNRSMA